MRQLKITKQMTNRENASLDKYLQEVHKEELIDAATEVDLAQKIKKWDQQALEKLVKANLRFVVTVAKQYQNQWLSLPDLINEGNLWLIKAAQRFDETRGFKFISYAVWWIRQTILKALAEQGRLIRLPLNKVGDLIKINRASAKLEQDLERDPTAEEIAEIMNKKAIYISDTLKISWKHMSLDAPCNNEDDSSAFKEILESDLHSSPENKLIDQDFKDDISRSLNKLEPREQIIIAYYFWVNGEITHTLDEMVEIFGLSKEQIRQIKEKAIRRLRQPTRSRNLEKYR